MKIIKLGSTDREAVIDWQYFLIGQGLLEGSADGDFGPKTHAATVAFQRAHGLQPDGIVGNKSYGAAMQLGFPGAASDDLTDKTSPNWPAKPSFPPLSTNAEREAVFGKFLYVHKPLPGNYEHIEVVGDWPARNLVSVDIPQLYRFTNRKKITFHRLAADQLKKLWNDWEAAGLLHWVLTYEGAYNPRFIRGGVATRTLSNHAFGTAFDINYAWNQLGAMPALVGQKGCVRELVHLAHLNGFYWGGHFSRKDGMHFEVAKLL